MEERRGARQAANLKRAIRLVAEQNAQVFLQKGRRLAEKLEVEHTIHRKDGVIGEKNSYGNDPVPPKDGH